MKRHTTQNHKQKNGQYFTTNASDLLVGFEYVVGGRTVTEPFAGGGDLTRWCLDNGATCVDEYDIEPLDGVTYNDSLMNPILTNEVVVTNPPYLSKNKNKDKRIYDIWKQNDYYKCHLAAIVANKVERGIVILPSNFLSESSSSVRDLFFSRYRMNKVKYYRKQVFEDATTGVVVFDFETWVPESTMTCSYEIHYDDVVAYESYTHTERNGWLVGDEFFDMIRADINFKITILREGMVPNSNIIIGLLDKGKYALGAHYNDGEPIYCSPKAFTTYQCVLSQDLTEEQQKLVVSEFNTLLDSMRYKYHSMFLSNYMGSKQKILSRKYAERLMAHVVSKL
jgi:hypothetical protein